MPGFIPHPTGVLEAQRLRTATVCVVDQRRHDYESWHATAKSARVVLEFVSSAEQALRFARQQRVDLWVINTELPELSGVTLGSMLKAQYDRAAVYFVADHYTPDAERAAHQARATLFGCKGAHSDWLGQWLQMRGPRSSDAAPHPSRCAMTHL